MLTIPPINRLVSLAITYDFTNYLTNPTFKLLNFTEKRPALDTSVDQDTVPCENCGKMELKSKLKKKPYCSALCAKTAKTSPEEPQPSNQTTTATAETKKQAIAEEPIKPVTEKASATVVPCENGIPTVTVTAEPVVMVHKWTVSEVCEFIKGLQSCSDLAEEFENQEIDGQALLLLTPDNLVTHMGLKLGPALKILDNVKKLQPATQED